MPDKFTYHYYSLESEEVLLTTIMQSEPGEVNLIVGGDSGYAGTFCTDDPDFICLMLPGVYFAIPKDLDKRIAENRGKSSIGWTFRGKDYVLEMDNRRRDYRILGHSFSAWWIRVESPIKGEKFGIGVGRYLWSSTCGLLAFTQLENEDELERDSLKNPYYDHFWVVGTMGFGATSKCGK